MPAMKTYIVRQVREVRVTANEAIDATRIAAAAFEYGQDANGNVAYEKAPEGIWGNTSSHIETIEYTVQLNK